MLIDQADAALARAVADQDLGANAADALAGDLAEVAGNLSVSGLPAAAETLIAICNAVAEGGAC